METGTVASKVWQRWHDRAEKRAMRDPVYAAIVAKLASHKSGYTLFSSEDGSVSYVDKVQRFHELIKTPWYWEAYRWWVDHRPSVQYKNAIAAYQRAKHGVSKRDTWNFDHYLSGVICRGVRDLRANLHSWPGDPMSFEEWEEILDKIIDGFGILHNVDYFEITEEQNAKVEEAWDLFRQYFNHLWD